MRYGFLVLFGVFMALTVTAWGQESKKDYYEPRFFESQPGTLFYLFQDDALWKAGEMSVIHRATADCVTPPAALEFDFPAVGGEAGVMSLDIAQTLQRSEEDEAQMPGDVIGISFWVKGNGSAAVGRVEMREDHRAPGGACEFPTGDGKWRRVMLRWTDFSPAVNPAKAEGISFGLKGGSPRPASYIVDALRYVKTADEDPELAKLAAAADGRKGEVQVPVRPSPSACTYNRGALAKARAKVHKGEGLKWLAYGDSVTVPVQLWNIPADLHHTEIAYYAGAARTLEKEFGCKIEIVVNAVGGRQLNEDFQGLPASLQKEKPDVLVLLSGDTIGNYRALMPQVLEAAKAAGTEVLVVVPTYERMPLRSPEVDWLRRFCIENNVACADARSYLLGMPEEYWGDTTANPSHPNMLGHRLIGQVVSEMFR